MDNFLVYKRKKLQIMESETDSKKILISQSLM